MGGMQILLHESYHCPLWSPCNHSPRWRESAGPSASRSPFIPFPENVSTHLQKYRTQSSRSFACAKFARLFTSRPEKIILQRRQRQVGAEISRARDAKHVRTLKESGGSEAGCVHVYVCVQTDYIPIRTPTYHRIFYFVIQRPPPPTSSPRRFFLFCGLHRRSQTSLLSPFTFPFSSGVSRVSSGRLFIFHIPSTITAGTPTNREPLLCSWKTVSRFGLPHELSTSRYFKRVT